MDREAWGWVAVFALIGAIIVGTLALIAFVASFLVPVELPIALFAVLTGMVIEYVVFITPANGLFTPANELFPGSDNGGVAVGVLTGAAWIAFVFALSTVLGPGPLFVGAVLVALAIACFVLVTIGGRAEVRNEAVREAELMRNWASGLADDPELAERLRAAGWQADGPFDETRHTYLRVSARLERERRGRGRPVGPRSEQGDLVKTAVVIEAVPGEPGVGSAPRDPQDL